MTSAPDKRPNRSQTLAGLAFGAGSAIAGTVYGTVVAMATLTAAYASEKHPWKLAIIVASTAIVLWVAHLYAHVLAESIRHERRPLWSEVTSVARRELGIVLAAAGPVAALVLGATEVVSDKASVWLAFAIGLATLFAEGVRYSRIERAGFLVSAAAIGTNLGLGLVVVALKVALAH
jgi:hypothetical protein